MDAFQIRTNTQILAILPQALAEGEMPNFTNYRPAAVYDAFQSVWEGMTPQQAWLESLKRQVEALSSGFTQLIEATPREIAGWHKSVRGPAVHLYLLQEQPDDSIQIWELIIGPYNDPVEMKQIA